MIRVAIVNGRKQLIYEPEQNPVYEKMSKSKNNSVSVDEALRVRDLDPNYEFVGLPPEYIYVDYKEIPVYKNQDGFYYTIRTFGHIPLLLADKRDQYIPRFDGPDGLVVQHESKIDPQYLED